MSKEQRIDILVESGGMTVEQGERAKKKWVEMQAQAQAEAGNSVPDEVKAEA